MAFFYFVIMLLIISFEIIRRKKFKFDPLSFFNGYFIIYYILPAIINNTPFLNHKNRYYSFVGNVEASIYGLLVVTTSYLMVVSGFYFTLKLKSKWKNIRVTLKNEEKFVKLIASLFLILSLGSLLAYTSIFGGLFEVISNANSIRDQSYEGLNEENSSNAFVKRFIIAANYSTFLLAGYVVGIKRTNKTIKIIFIISLVSSIFWFLIHAGRGALILFIITLIFGSLRAKVNTDYRINLKQSELTKKVIFTVIIGFIIINYARPFFMSLSMLKYGLSAVYNAFIDYSSSGRYSITGMEDVIRVFSNNTEYKYISTEVAINVVNSGIHQMSFFGDFAGAFISVIPSSFLWFSKPSSIEYFNTIYIMGGHYTQIPPGGIAYGYYSLSILGVIIFSFITGMLGGKIEKFFNYTLSEVKFMSYIYVSTIFVWLDLFFSGEPRHFIQREFVYLFFFMMIYYGLKKVGEPNTVKS
ncbi:hypothetical protein FIU87_19590 [Bacillus sp. THAF10]|uniref:O-antigen polymerase n=1 Tax=Bacillus sp. THAF10 TaxID=2587848 RepID=UPI001267C4F3|nr:O-antigen polymerase [Bacillus sp. THAF10]QFT90854.1 hypothetical protein FIU87_19590 [Bacillus sp. THAF10]